MFPRGTYCCSCLQQTCAASISLLASLWFCSFFDAPQRDAVLLLFAANARCLSPMIDLLFVFGVVSWSGPMSVNVAFFCLYILNMNSSVPNALSILAPLLFPTLFPAPVSLVSTRRSFQSRVRSSWALRALYYDYCCSLCVHILTINSFLCLGLLFLVASAPGGRRRPRRRHTSRLAPDAGMYIYTYFPHMSHPILPIYQRIFSFFH